MDKYVLMGVIGRPHGLAGEVTLRWEGEEVPEAGQEIFLGGELETLSPYRVKSLRMHKGFPLLGLEGVTNRDEAEALRGENIYIPRAHLAQPGEDEAWLEDLIGARIFLEDGIEVGKLDHLEFPAGQELWAIRTESGREILFPARPEFIETIDVENGVVTIAPPPGLLDIYLA